MLLLCGQENADWGGGGQMFANFKKVGHAAETLALIRKFDQISTYNSFILLVMVGHSQLSFCNTLFFFKNNTGIKTGQELNTN